MYKTDDDGIISRPQEGREEEREERGRGRDKGWPIPRHPPRGSDASLTITS